MFTDIRKLPDTVLPEELTLFDTTVLEPRLWFGGSNNLHANSFKQKILDSIDDGKIKNAAVLEDFAYRLPKMYKITDGRTLGYFTDWLQSFNLDEKHVIYTVKPPFGKIEEGYRDLESRIEPGLVELGLGGNSIFLTAASINYNIPTIVTNSMKLARSESYIREICDKGDIYLNAKFHIYGVKEYCAEKGLIEEASTQYNSDSTLGLNNKTPIKKMGKRPKSPGNTRGMGKPRSNRISANYIG